MLICFISPGSSYSEIPFFSPLTLTYSICKISLEGTSRRNNCMPNSSASTDFYLCALSPCYFESTLGLKTVQIELIAYCFICGKKVKLV